MKLDSGSGKIVENNLQVNEQLNSDFRFKLEEKELLSLMKDNLNISLEIERMIRSLNRRLRVNIALAWIKILVILVPILIGSIYLPPLIKEALSTYSNLIK